MHLPFFRCDFAHCANAEISGNVTCGAAQSIVGIEIIRDFIRIFFGVIGCKMLNLKNIIY